MTIRPIGEVRRAHGVLQRQAAEKISVSRSTWGRYERAEKYPKRLSLTRRVMLKAIQDVATELGNDVQLDVEDFTGKPKHRRKAKT